MGSRPWEILLESILVNREIASLPLAVLVIYKALINKARAMLPYSILTQLQEDVVNFLIYFLFRRIWDFWSHVIWQLVHIYIVMFRVMSYSCPDCGCHWSLKNLWRHTWWTPIVCPKCSARFHIEKRQWRNISFPILASVAVLLVVQFVAKNYLGKYEYLVLFSVAYGVFIITSIWWLRTVFTKLRLERHDET